MNELHLFAGAGGGILGGMLLGHTTVCAVEIEPYCRKVLLQRQRDGVLPKFPIWDNVCTFDGNPWRGKVDVVCGGFPCQDISAAGKGAGIEGERSGLWKEMARIVGEIRPRYVFIENSPLLRTRGLSVVLKDLAEMGCDARWGVLGAADIGANHQRNRIWILANPNCTHGKGNECAERTQEKHSNLNSPSQLANTKNQGNVWRNRIMDASKIKHNNRRSQTNGGGQWWEIEPSVGRVVDGVASRVDRLKAIGNGQVPAVAATAFRTLTENQ